MIQSNRQALWASHSSIQEYLKCPRAYYLHYVYKDPHTHHKITVMTPALALGQAVHDTLDLLSSIRTDDRFNIPLSQRFEMIWKNLTGQRGGFNSDQEESAYKERGYSMIKRISTNPGPLARLAVKINMEIPHFYLSESDNIILCGRIDWLEYFPDSDSVGIIDFKTSTREESRDSLQLPIYMLLSQACQKRPVISASYWYLDSSDIPVSKELPDPILARERVLSIAKEMALSRKLNRLRCRQEGGCRSCKPFEAILAGKAQYVYTNNRDQDVYILPDQLHSQEDLSEIL